MSQCEQFEAGTVATAGLAGTTARKYTFSRPRKAFYFENTTGQTVYVAYNGATASASNYDEPPIANNAKMNLTPWLNSGLRVDEISVWIPTSGTIANLKVRGAG